MTLGNEVFIGANSGTGGCHKFKELLNNTQKMEMTNTKINDINIKVGERTKVELETMVDQLLFLGYWSQTRFSLAHRILLYTS
jgi:hypothetical protein